MKRTSSLHSAIAQSYFYSVIQLPLGRRQPYDPSYVKVIQALPMTDDADTDATDVDLLGRFRAGDRDAALHLYYRYADRLFRIAIKNTSSELSTHFDPEDIVQSVFRTFFRRATSGQYEAPEGDELWKLLLVMALNKVRTRSAYHRASKRDIRKTQSLVEETNVSLDHNAEEAKRILEMSVDEMIQKQPESHREIIRLRIDGMDVQAIANHQHRSKRTVERVLQSFRTQLMASALVSSGETDT
jgi:RNA polymerase sigma-70 factor, ECF subfamily